MKKLVFLAAFLAVVSTASLHAQRSYSDNNYKNHRVENRSNYDNARPNHHPTKCAKNGKRAKKAHHRRMRKMAAADGRVSPREKSMLRRSRNVGHY